MPFLIDSYTFSPVPWKGKDPLRRIKRITPKKDNAIISLHVHSTVETNITNGFTTHDKKKQINFKTKINSLYKKTSLRCGNMDSMYTIPM